MQKISKLLIMNIIFISHESYGSWFDRSCDLSVESKEKILIEERTLDNRGVFPGEGRSANFGVVGGLTPGFFLGNDKEKAKDYGLKVCLKLEASLKADPDFKYIENSLTCKSDYYLANQKYNYTDGTILEWYTSYNDVYTYVVKAKWKVYVPALTDDQIKKIKINKVEDCIRKESNSEKLMELYKIKEQLQGSSAEASINNGIRDGKAIEKESTHIEEKKAVSK